MTVLVWHMICTNIAYELTSAEKLDSASYYFHQSLSYLNDTTDVLFASL